MKQRKRIDVKIDERLILTEAQHEDYLNQLRVFRLSTAHLTQSDVSVLDSNSASSDRFFKIDMVFFIKLLEGCESNLSDHYSDELNAIIKRAHTLGCRTVEFNCDAPEIGTFPSF